jgi:hypothetical protein
MNITNFINCGPFAICLGHSPSAGTFHQPNVGNLACNLFLYVVKGGGSANEEQVQLGANDLSKFVGAPIDYEFGENGVTWIVVNVTNGEASSCVQIPSGQHLIEGAKDKYVAVLSGQITANDKLVPEHKFVRVREGVAVTISIPDGAVAVEINTKSA